MGKEVVEMKGRAVVVRAVLSISPLYVKSPKKKKTTSRLLKRGVDANEDAAETGKKKKKKKGQQTPPFFFPLIHACRFLHQASLPSAPASQSRRATEYLSCHPCALLDFNTAPLPIHVLGTWDHLNPPPACISSRCSFATVACPPRHPNSIFILTIAAPSRGPTGQPAQMGIRAMQKSAQMNPGKEP